MIIHNVKKVVVGVYEFTVLFIFLSTDILSSEQPELDTDCEIIWAKVDIIGVKSIYIGAYYKPQENDIETYYDIWFNLVDNLV
jgi:hypothetical protein